MANLAPTEATPQAGAKLLSQYTTGAALAIGDAVYLSTTSVWLLADSNAGVGPPDPAATKGIVITAAAAIGLPVIVQVQGPLKLGAAISTKGLIIVQSATPGKMAPSADLASGWRTTVIGVMQTTDILDIHPNGPWATGYQLA